MAIQPRKRQHVDDRSRSDAEPPTKKTKTRSEAEREAWASWVYPPEFWDRLPELSLTRKAVAEHNRRTRLQRRLSPRPIPVSPSTSLAQFARHGGPDLTDLRGYPHPVPTQPAAAMSASESAESRATGSVDPASTLPTTATTKTTKTKRSTPYNRDFDLHLKEFGIHPEYSSQEPDLEETLAAMAVPRPSLSPSKFDAGAFKEFRYKNARAKDENEVVNKVFPIINGSYPPDEASAGNTVFGNLAPLTDGTIAPAVPDIYHGTHPEELSRPVRDELGHHIMPSTMLDKPLVPSFFVELKGPNGTPAVAERQARYDGAIGARAMHSLQNYGQEEPQYDGQAYTYSSTYHAGMLQMYAHHPTAPTGEGGRPEYHMTHMKSYALNSDLGAFVQGATAFRNVRDLAKRHRDGFIRAANDRASGPRNTEQSIQQSIQQSARQNVEQNVEQDVEQNIGQDVGQGIEQNVEQNVEQYEEYDTYEAFESYEPLETVEEVPAADQSQQWCIGDEELQQSIANASGYDYDGGEAYANPQSFYAEAGWEEPFGDGPSMGIASSSTSGHKRPSSHAGRDRESKGQKGQKGQKEQKRHGKRRA